MNQKDMVVRIFKALGHPIRYDIVKFLLDEPKCVCKLNENIEFTQSNLSQHLRILKDAGVLKSEKQGLKIIYSITNDEIKNLIKNAETIVDDCIKNIK
ncbi:putative HTH-type transcriptional regulator [Clostridium tepidiprofundi DSM 19306]|uniref:Putative HTH-type transcriptional regulator n=1 Tax=Clostridium tepidiprofundi DSM 19306 TaxID=1121338 RepID=A0A151ATP7_9CLOT|nr:metalloregulator ArsR/SmtB family transcription factor [Clostridium tepidiprofundi]KYH30991.1 putative HTH-type transcriptional regulator [Clostridium tepidiprofundi DSM 19306]